MIGVLDATGARLPIFYVFQSSWATIGGLTRHLVWLQVRLMLVLAPATCALAGIGAHEAILLCARSIRAPQTEAAAPVAGPSSDVMPQKKRIVMKGGKVRGPACTK